MLLVSYSVGSRPNRHCHAPHVSDHLDTSYHVQHRSHPLHSPSVSLVDSDSVFVCSVIGPSSAPPSLHDACHQHTAPLLR